MAASPACGCGERSPALNLSELNRLPTAPARNEFLRCCGSTRWAATMETARPFRDVDQLMAHAREIWQGLGREDFLEAFAAHPEIGDLEHLRSRFHPSEAWSEGEQAGVAEASEATLQRLARGNRLYKERFGYIFIVCASGKSAEEMLSLLEERLPNDPAEELTFAAAEQENITRLRLLKLLDSGDSTA